MPRRPGSSPDSASRRIEQHLVELVRAAARFNAAKQEAKKRAK